ncbi:MAG: DUF983 domain-containing protein [Micavibrio sp.]|nr:DUF983 domain-containing protein [Micavibrio sp.]
MTTKTTSPTFLQAIGRGFMKRCPKCGEGRLFGKQLKVVDTCTHCGEEYFHQRADDFPAYLVILIVGHIIVPLAVYVETTYSPSYWVHLALWLPLTLVMTLGLLEPIKGAIVAIQWYGGMLGFAPAKAARDLAAGR